MEKSKGGFKKVFLFILGIIIIYWAINNITIIGNVFSRIADILFPFILGGCIAFILNIPMSFLERKFLSEKNKNDKKKKTNKNKTLIKIISMILSILVIAIILTLIIKLIVPELINIVNLLIYNIPYYTEELTNIIQNNGEEIQGVLADMNITPERIKTELISNLSNILTSSISIVGSIITTVTNFIVAIIFAIYILMNKEKLQEQIKKLLYAYLSKDWADKVVNIGSTAKAIFSSFFTVQCLEATILGTLCIIGMLILKIPYAVPIGVLIGVTALVPIIGAFIGIIIGAILILSVAPFKVITFVIFVLILQQIEGNLIYPKVVGDSVGLPGIWVLVAVSVGGKLFGIVGMLVGVPIASVIYTLIKKDVDKKLKDKNVVEI